MDRSYYSMFESVQGAKLTVNAMEDRSKHENGSSRLVINVQARRYSWDLYDYEAEPVDFQVWLTVPQVAEIVKAFFWPIVSQNRVFRELLSRLLRKRRTEMTAELARRTDCMLPEPKFEMPRYDQDTRPAA